MVIFLTKNYFKKSHLINDTRYPLSMQQTSLTFNDLIFITNLKDSQREGVRELFITENETAPCLSIHINAGQSVQLGVHPV